MIVLKEELFETEVLLAVQSDIHRMPAIQMVYAL